ncbi:MAG: sugar phosphate isomerase/epimerase family protein [Dehalococcoidia bacterium]|jgi:xylose isomerase
MKKDIKFAAAISALGNPGDRFMSGYKEDRSAAEMFALAAEAGISGLEFVYGRDVTDENVDEIKGYMEKHGLKCCDVLPNLFGRKEFIKGSISSRDQSTAKAAAAEIRRTIDITKKLGGSLVNIWPGQDGYDYPFESDYLKAWGLMIELLQEAADYDPAVRLGLEYKFKEPRVHSYISTVAKSLLLCQAVDRPNVGVILDIGHAILAYENAAESLALARMFGDRLFLLHINDTRPDWDWDLNVGSVHFLDTLEWLYWADKTSYDGYYTLDIWPARMDTVEAIRESIEWIRTMRRALERIGDTSIENMMREGNPARAMKIIREAVFR